MTIRGVDKVILGVRDQDAAVRFWVETLGFDLVTDTPYGENGERWLEVRTPDGETTVVLSADPDDQYRFPAREGMPTANIFLYADDIEQAYAELAAKGVEFPTPPAKQPWGWWATFADQDGNRFALGQR